MGIEIDFVNLMQDSFLSLQVKLIFWWPPIERIVNKTDELARLASLCVPIGPEQILGLSKFKTRKITMSQSQASFETYYKMEPSKAKCCIRFDIRNSEFLLYVIKTRLKLLTLQKDH